MLRANLSKGKSGQIVRELSCRDRWHSLEQPGSMLGSCGCEIDVGIVAMLRYNNYTLYQEEQAF